MSYSIYTYKVLDFKIKLLFSCEVIYYSHSLLQMSLYVIWSGYLKQTCCFAEVRLTRSASCVVVYPSSRPALSSNQSLGCFWGQPFYATQVTLHYWMLGTILPAKNRRWKTVYHHVKCFSRCTQSLWSNAESFVISFQFERTKKVQVTRCKASISLL